MLRPSNWFAIGLLGLVLAACHDAPRKNPFDPELTPAVEAAATVDDTAGVAQIRWTPYQGSQPFAEYQVLRKVQGFEAVDTVAHIPDFTQLSYTDTSIVPDVNYIYWIDVINLGGFANSSNQVSVASFSVTGVELLAAQGENTSGAITLRWTRYRGANFAAYQVWRGSFGQEDQRLDMVSEVDDTTWTDTTPLPSTGYAYWIVTDAAGKEIESLTREIAFELPPVEIDNLVFSSLTASAQLDWTPYTGPRFSSYEIHRTAAGIEQSIALLDNIDTTTYTDTLLDGNTQYTYRIIVQTSYTEEDIQVSSRSESGLLYALEQVNQLPQQTNSAIQAVALAFDETDQLFTAITSISTTTAGIMQEGVQILYPGSLSYRSYFTQHEPARLSPIRVVVGGDRVYLAVGIVQNQEPAGILLGAIDEDRRELWSAIIPTEDTFPAGIFFEPNGDVWVVDDEGEIYLFDPEGNGEDPSDLLASSLTTDQALPLIHVIGGRGAGRAGNDQFFFLSPDRAENHVIGRTLILNRDNGEIFLRDRTIFGGRQELDDGVGPDDGETLNPLVLAFDPLLIRLVILEETGRLQVLDASPEDRERRYITKWGRFGASDGEFQVSPPTSVAMAVDSQGRIHVADGEERIQIFVP